MASSNSVTILEVDQISPSTDSILTELTLPLTFSDLFWLRAPPTERVIFYKLTESNTRESFDSLVLPKLKNSLSIALFHYLPLAGRLTWNPVDPKPTIKYTPTDTVSLTVAESTGDLAHLAGNGVREALAFHALVPELSISDHNATVISLQVTFFVDQGFSIGITTHHCVMDGKTMTNFLKSWGHICKQLQHETETSVSVSLPDELTPSFDRDVINDPTGLDMKLINAWVNFTKTVEDPVNRNLKLLPSGEIDPNMVRVTFELTREDISKLRDMITRRVENPDDVNQLRLSTYVLAFAYLMVCMVKARGGDENRGICFGLVADYRTRLEPPVPSTYFGNCIQVTLSLANAGDFTGENGLLRAVERVSETVNSLSKETFGKGIETMELMMSIEPGTQGVSVAGSPQFGIYGIDFGWGKPEKVEVVSIDHTGAFSMSDCRDKKGGVEIGSSLSKDEMEKFLSLFFEGLKN